MLTFYEHSTGVDFVIATDPEDAWALWEEFMGERREDYASETWEDLPPDRRFTMHFPDEAPRWLPEEWATRLSDEGDRANDTPRLTLTCAEWCRLHGRGYFASTEY